MMIATTVMVLCAGLIISHIPCGFSVPSQQLPTLTNEGALATLPDEAVLTREELFDLDPASIDDLPYRLDLVDCPKAKEIEGSSATYKTSVYYKNSKKGYRCCVRQKRGLYETIPITLSNNQAVVTGRYDQGLVQRISFTCPEGQGGMLSNLQFNLPPPVRLGGKAICIDSLLFVLDGQINQLDLCEFCGDTPTSNCWRRTFSQVSVTFRSSYRSLNTNFNGFNFTITCTQIATSRTIPAQQESINTAQTTSTCLQMADDLPSNSVERELLLAVSAPSEIPSDAPATLAEYIELVSSGIKHDNMLRLASLCRRSCDKAVANLAEQLLGLLRASQ